MKCFNCLDDMIEIKLINANKKEYKAAHCLKCGRFVTGIGEKKVWIGEKAC